MCLQPPAALTSFTAIPVLISGDLLRPTATIDRMLNLNINAVIKNVHAVLPHMMEQGSGDSAVTCSLAGHSAIKHDL
jgi:ribitol 2-dehydrogenase